MSQWFLRRSMKIKVITVVLATFMVFAGVGAVVAANQKDSAVKGDYAFQKSSPETELLSQRARIDANRTVVETTEEAIPFATTSTYDSTLQKDTTVVRVEGMNGKKVVKSEVRYKNGVEISRSLISENVTVPAVNKVVAIGTKVVAKTTKPSELPVCPEAQSGAARELDNNTACAPVPATDTSDDHSNH